MDAQRFDRLVRAFSVQGTRRRALHFLVAPPFLGVLAALLEEREVSADGSGAGIGGNRNKHRNRKARQHRGSHEPRREKRCRPKSKAKTCANNCGPVRNNCKKTVDCGPCDCDPPCPACSTCDSDRNCISCDPCCNDVCCSAAGAVCHAQTGACCVPDSHAQTCTGQCGEILNNCGFSEDCGPCDCGVCPACHICDAASGDCVPDPDEEGESCGDGQFCLADGRCECDDDSCGACRTCGGGGACQDCSGCCDGAVCVEDCACGHECCDGFCCAAGEVCQGVTCCARDCAAVACGSGAPETCGVANCGTCPAGQTCLDNACEAVCGPGTCPQECNCLIRPDGTPTCLASLGGTCIELCRDDSDCCPGTSCGALPGACGGQFVCYVLGDPCGG